MLHVVCKDQEMQKAVLSQLKISARAMYSNPPIHGALLVYTILSNNDLYDDWRREIKMMAEKSEAKQTRPRGQTEQDRQQRLNKALRENLLKRKQQSRSRQNLQTPEQKP